MNDQEFAARLAALDEHHLRFLDEVGKTNQRLAESRRQCTADLAESGQQFDHELTERDARWTESDRRFWERLDLYDQRDVAFVRHMEQLREKVYLLSGQSGQIADELVEHKRDPGAHA